MGGSDFEKQKHVAPVFWFNGGAFDFKLLLFFNDFSIVRGVWYFGDKIMTMIRDDLAIVK